MSEIVTVALDPAQSVFQAHCADVSGQAIPHNPVLLLLSPSPRCIVAMEASGGVHFRGREIGRPGHEVPLIPPAYVKLFVKRQKNEGEEGRGCSAAA